MKYLIIFIWICMFPPVSGQEQPENQGLNQLDVQGRKTGPWKVDYPNGKTQYRATFLEGRPVGEMVRYYETGAVQARMDFDTLLDRSFTKLFYENGRKAAEGWYVEKEKDSVWTYFSEYDGTVRIREPYVGGKLHGKAKSYYPSGEVSEEINWEQQFREGPWKQFYIDGSLRLETRYEKNLLNGPYQVYYPDSTLKVSGYYVENRSHGTWDFYDESGSVVYSVEYEHGLPVDREKYLQLIQDSLQRFMELPEPEPLQQF
jgi:antitoxin component YwqK of YwqJK toxin-antitoxin module